MAGTKLVAVRSALIAGLDGLAAFDGVRCDMTWKANTQKREQAFTKNADFDHAPASQKAGRTFRNETGRFELVILVTGVGKDATWSATRAVALGTAAEEWVADNRNTIGVSGVNWVVVAGRGVLTELYADKATLAELIYPITYDARLT